MSVTSRSSAIPYGFSLLEVLVATALMLMLFGLIFAFLIPGMRTYALGSSQAEMQQEATMLLRNIANDLDLAVSAGVTVSPAVLSTPNNGPVYLAVMKIESINDKGQQIWKDALYVYYWEKPGAPVIRKQWTSTSLPSLGKTLNAPIHFTDSELAQIISEPTLKTKVMARDVINFEVYGATGSTWPQPPYNITVEISRKAATGKQDNEKFKLNRIFSLRNNQ
ncbi:MAG: type II secretion system protein J [Vulcanimicrobiota bacterium]